MNDKKVQQLINAYIDGELDAKNQFRVLNILKENQETKQELNQLKQLKQLISQLSNDSVSPAFDVELNQKLESTHPKSYFLPSFDFSFGKAITAFGVIGLILGIYFGIDVVQNNNGSLIAQSDTDKSATKRQTDDRTSDQKKVFGDQAAVVAPPATLLEPAQEAGWNGNSDNPAASDNGKITFENSQLLGEYISSYFNRVDNLPRDYKMLLKDFLVEEAMLMGKYYEHDLGDMERARMCYNRVISLAPDSKEAAAATQVLNRISNN